MVLINKYARKIFSLTLVMALVGASLPVGIAAAAATTYVVDDTATNCSDAGPGTLSQPFCTIAHGAAVAQPGDTVQVDGGPYTGTSVNPAASGLAGSPITFEAAAGVAINGGTSAFALSGRSYIVIDGFTISGTSSYGIVASSSNNITISNNTITGAGQQASGSTAGGIKLFATTASLVTHNTTDHNSDHGIFVTSGSANNTISYNEASYNAEGWQRNANGINVNGSNATGNILLGNVVHDNEDSGLQFFSGANNGLAADNVSYNNGDHGIDDYNVTGGRLIGNTAYHNCTSGINVEGTSGSYLIENNVAVDNAVYPAYNGISCNRRKGNIGVYDSAPATTTANFNAVYNTASGGAWYVWNNTTYNTQADLYAATGQEAQGLFADPMFADSANWNLQLTEGSPAIDSADSNASGQQAADILGNARVDDPNVANTGVGVRTYDDRGAYEFQPAAASTPSAQIAPTAALAVTPTSGTVPLPVTADASASTAGSSPIVSYAFDFGDGTTTGAQTAATATHTYSTAGTYTVTVTVTDSNGLASKATAQVVASNPPVITTNTTPAAYVNQIATNYSTATHTSGSIKVWRSAGVKAGDLIVATVQLTGTSAGGTVTGTDAAGDTLTTASDISDGAGNRLVVLSGVAQKGLASGDTITISFPSAASYRIVGDEVANATTVDQQAAASGTGAQFDSGSTGTTARPGEFVFAATATFGGTSLAWSTGWNTATSYTTGSNALGRAYQIPATTGTFDATGTASGAWLSTVITFE